MIGDRRQRSSSTRAASILREIFEDRATGFAFRLWDGTDVVLGPGSPRFTVVFHARATFTRLMREPTPLRFAEAFVEGAIDIDGDLFAAMDVANALEDLKLPLPVRLRILTSVWAT